MSDQTDFGANQKLLPWNKRNVHFMSERHDWETPQFLFDGLNAEFGFELDVCATAENAKCRRFFTLADDGLAQVWTGVCWMNPPYGRDIEMWMKKAFHSSEMGALVACLVPARTDTRWWHKYSMRGEIRYLRGRLKFGNCENSAPFPSAVVIFRPRIAGHLPWLQAEVQQNIQSVEKTELRHAKDDCRVAP